MSARWSSSKRFRRAIGGSALPPKGNQFLDVPLCFRSVGTAWRIRLYFDWWSAVKCWWFLRLPIVVSAGKLYLASKIMFGWFNSSGASPVGRVGGTIKLSLLYTRVSLLLYIVCTAMIVDKQERGDMVCQLLPWDQWCSLITTPLKSLVLYIDNFNSLYFCLSCLKSSNKASIVNMRIFREVLSGWVGMNPAWTYSRTVSTHTLCIRAQASTVIAVP